MTDGGVVIVGAGQAGLQAAASLRDLGYPGRISLIGDEGSLPYQRPPLSKAYMLGEMPEDGLHLRNQRYLDQNDIRLVGSERVVRIERGAKRVELGSGGALSYQHLILATGARNRTLSIPGAERTGVHALRTIADAVLLKTRMPSARRAVVIGGGFIGMEFAAVAAKLGVRTHVVEAAPRIMARAVSPAISAYFTRRHADRGTTFSFADSVVCVNGDGDKVVSVQTAKGATFPADLVLIGVGVIPAQELAEAAGLTVAGGILVDDQLLTSDPAISAIGDCAVHPNRYANGMLRLESVQNAVDQGRAVAARITGKPAPYAAVPWFWSDQAEDKLQIAGIATGNEVAIVKGDESVGRFSVFRFRNDALVCVESVNKAADHMAARALLKAGRLASLTPRHVFAHGFDMKSCVSKEVVNA